MFKCIKRIFVGINYKRDIPEDLRKQMHDLLDTALDTPSWSVFCNVRYNLSKKIESARELYDTIESEK